MYRKNVKHLQSNFFGMSFTFAKKFWHEIEASAEYLFYKLIFCKIPEAIFAKLYSHKKSRPNSPCNSMMSALILKEYRAWTYAELFDSIKFNILTKVALGLDRLDDLPFCEATLFNFQNRLSEHFIKTGENLFEVVFDQLTTAQLNQLKLKTNIQRADSFQAASNIRNYTRLQLLVEMLLRVHRALSELDQQKFQVEFAPYLKYSSAGQYLYHLKPAQLPSELEKIGQLYQALYQQFFSTYSEMEIFKTFERIYTEHFAIVAEKITVKPAEELTSDCAQSPDDLDATYREKNGARYKGQVINVVETAHPDNQLNLIIDVAVNPNNTDDGQVLNNRLEKILEKTPDLDEMHVDGGYGNTELDQKCEPQAITIVQTAVRGRSAAVPIEIEAATTPCDEPEYQVSCPCQTVTSTPTKTRHKAQFDAEICAPCEHREHCPVIARKNFGVFYFSHADYLSRKRQKNIYKIPIERRKIRSNVEATVHEFTCKMPHKKLKVRGAFKTAIFAYSVAMGINFGRIFRYRAADPAKFKAHWRRLWRFLYYFFKELAHFGDPGIQFRNWISFFDFWPLFAPSNWLKLAFCKS